jgi:hypothetical protein
MATPTIDVPFGAFPAHLRTTAFFSRCGCGYVFSSTCKQRGHPFPPLFQEILAEIMPVTGVISEEFWPTCVNVTWYRDGYRLACILFNLLKFYLGAQCLDGTQTMKNCMVTALSPFFHSGNVYVYVKARQSLASLQHMSKQLSMLTSVLLSQFWGES